jgi:hypothetical protein
MKIELKKIQTFERMSEETNAFVADVYINGKNVGTAKNDGHGGETYLDFIYRDNETNNQLVKDAIEYLKTLPPVISDLGGTPFELKMDFPFYVDTLLENHLKEKENKKKEKLYTIGFVFGKPDGYSYRYITYKGKPTLISITQKVGGLQFLQKELNRIKTDMKEGEKFFNEDHLKSIGLNV